MRKKLSLPLLMCLGGMLSSCSLIGGDFSSGFTSQWNNSTSLISSSLYSGISSSVYPGSTRFYYADDDGHDKYYLAFKEENVNLTIGENFDVKIFAYHEDLSECSHSDEHYALMSSSDESVIKIDDTKIVAVGVGTCTVYYETGSEGKYWDSMSVTVCEKTLSSLRVEKGRSEYLKDSSFDFSGKVIASYENGYEEEVTDYVVDDTSVNTSVSGTYPLYISYTYKGVTKKCTFSIKIVDSMGVNEVTMDYNLDDMYDHSWKTKTPSSGNIKALVIPVMFSDSANYFSSSKKNNVIADLNTAFFGSEEDCGQDSVKSYYEKESGGKISLSGTVSEFYSPGQASSYYDDSSMTKASALVKEAVDWFFSSNPSESRTSYDADGDGVLDYVALIYGRTSQSRSSGTMPCYWPKVVKQSVTKNVSSPAVGHYFWATYADMYSPDSSDTVERIGSSKGSGDNSHCTLDTHTFRHESGHMFGLEDYYNYGSDPYYPAGSYSMQDNNTGSHDPFSLLLLGWARAYVPLDTSTFDILDFASSRQMILLTPDFNDSPFDEYILIELYSPTGINKFDAVTDNLYGYCNGINVPGIRVWHIDARLTKYTDGAYTTSLSTDPTSGTMEFAMSNSFSSSSKDSPLGAAYMNYNLLQYIRNDEEETYYGENKCSAENLFFEGDTFKMETYKSQFVNEGKLNSGLSLGWEIKVNTLTSSFANITCTKK